MHQHQAVSHLLGFWRLFHLLYLALCVCDLLLVSFWGFYILLHIPEPVMISNIFSPFAPLI